MFQRHKILVVRAALLIFFALLAYDIAVAGFYFQNPFLEESGCTKGSTIFIETFENIADTEEWSNDGNWTETPASADYFVGDNAVAYAGSLSGLCDNLSNGNYINHLMSEVTSGYVTFQFYIYVSAVNVTLTNVFTIADDTITSGANQRVNITSSVSGTLQITDNATQVDMVSISASTWYLVEVEVNTSQTDGINAVRVWINGTEGTGSPYDTVSQTNPSGVDRAGHASDSSGDYWIDNHWWYQGARCAS